MKKRKIGLSVVVVILALLVAVSFVAISHLLIKTGTANPSVNIDISALVSGDNDSSKTESAVSESVNQETEEPNPEAEEPNPEVELIGGKGEIYHKEIQVFCAEYDNDGKITVKSDYGNQVVAPGTENSYDLYVRNVGNVPISYVLEAQSHITVDVNGKQTEIPIKANFIDPNNNYLLGKENEADSLAKLDGVKDSSGLSPQHQAKYTLYWSWPFDGDDELDTLLGNLAAEGEELTVKVAFSVTASYDPNAEGGALMTGDSSNIGLLAALFVISAFTLIILLFWRKREQDEENSQTHKEKL